MPLASMLKVLAIAASLAAVPVAASARPPVSRIRTRVPSSGASARTSTRPCEATTETLT